jgi:hypothetical protein
MTRGSRVCKPDEKLALRLLEGHFAARGEKRFQCKHNPNDPPDLIIIWEDGARWGVEVTRAYQQVNQIGNTSIVSSEYTTATLLDFANKIGDEARDVRNRSYTLYLEGPGPLSSWRQPDRKQKWMRENRRKILNPIKTGKHEALDFPEVS